MVRGIKTLKRIIILSLLLSGSVWEANAEGRPVIGVSDASKDGKNAAVPRSYIDAVLRAGGIPVVIPVMYDEQKVVELLDLLDGIIFAGGEDFDPAYYNERPVPQMGRINIPRDEFEMKLVHLAAERRIPVLGICRGLQLINIAFGGSLYQDLPAQYDDNSIRHRQKQPNDEASHTVYVEHNTVFADIVKERALMVNSSHHQAVKKIAPGFRVAGQSPDKVVEAIEKVNDENWILGVQFHPEALISKDQAMLRIFRRFIDEASSMEKPDRTVKTVPVQSPELLPPAQMIHKSVIDTQFIYKFIRDTQYLHASVDTVYIPVPDTRYIQMPADTIYVTDTVYLPIPEKTTSLPDEPGAGRMETASDTLPLLSGSKKVKDEKEEVEAKQKQYQKEQAGKAKQNKKAQEEKALQEKKALKEKEKQKKKEQREQVEKEKWARKELKEKEKQFKREQKEREKLDKQELKKMEKLIEREAKEKKEVQEKRKS